MSSVKDVIARGSVDELAEFMATRRGVEMNESLVLWAVKCDSVEIVREWMTPEMESAVMDKVVMTRPGKVLDWLIEEERLKVPGVNDWGVHCGVWLRLLMLDPEHPYYAGEFGKCIRTLAVMDNKWITDAFIRGAMEKFALEDLEWLEVEFGEDLWCDVRWTSLMHNPHADVVERFYDTFISSDPKDQKDVWGILCRGGTPEVAEVVRRRLLRMTPPPKKYSRPTVADMCGAMERGNLAMYRWIGQEFGKVVKYTKRMFLACCENGEPDDVRDYWLDDPKTLAEGAVRLFGRGMCELVEEMVEKGQTKMPDPKVFTRAVRMHSNKVGVLQGIVLMEWGGAIQMTKAIAKDLGQTAQMHGYWPWFQGATHTGDIFFTRAEILMKG